jgi:phosphoribosylglycinamide formyltransferase-1
MNLSFPLSPVRLAVLISGGGTTLRNLLAKIDAGQLDAQVVTVVSSNPEARGLEFARAASVPTAVVERRHHGDLPAFSDAVFGHVRAAEPHLVVMGGFLKLIHIPADFQNRVMNIHPALIPAFCGQGFYGHRVHQAVLDYRCKVTGCTVHFVDQQYDHGPIILQAPVSVRDDDTAETLAARVFEAECELYPRAIRLFAAGRLRVEGRHVRITGD